MQAVQYFLPVQRPPSVACEEVQERDEAARREKVNRERSNRRFIKRNRSKQYNPKRQSYSKRQRKAILVAGHSYIEMSVNQYCSENEPIVVRRRSYIASYRYAVVLLSTTRVVMPRRSGIRASGKVKKETIPRDGGTVSFLRVG